MKNTKHHTRAITSARGEAEKVRRDPVERKSKDKNAALDLSLRPLNIIPQAIHSHIKERLP